MDRPAIILLEILMTVVLPLLALYLRSAWPLRTTIPCLLLLPVAWYLSYAPLHELSHVAGAYLAGGSVSEARLLPPFWAGEWSKAWIVPVGLVKPWQTTLMTAFPYLVDLLCLSAAPALLRRLRTRGPLLVGFAFLMLLLRPTFDLTCETVAHLGGHRGDLFHLGAILGQGAITAAFTLALGAALFSIALILRALKPAASR